MDLGKVLARKVVPAATIEKPELAVPLARALLEGGLNVIEVTFRTAAAAAIRAITARFPEMAVGAGTVLTVDQVAQAADAGATFLVAPGLNEHVVAAARQRGLPMIPGVMTPSEVDRALELGCKVLKFFPADAAGGIKMLKSLAGPYGHTGVKFLPTGGIDARNMRDYLALPMVAGVGGSWMVEKTLVATQNWTKIEALTREALVQALA